MLRIMIEFENGGSTLTAPLDLAYDKFHRPKNEVIFSSYIKPLKIIDIVDGVLIEN